MFSLLQVELKKRGPFASLEQEATLNVLRTADRFDDELGRLLRQAGLTNSQYNVLRILRGEGAPLPCLEIADRMVQGVPGLTGLVDRLERQGYVARRRSRTDRRVVYVEILPAGLELLGTLDQPVLALHQRLLGHMPAEELTLLSRLLEKARRPRVAEETTSQPPAALEHSPAALREAQTPR